MKRKGAGSEGGLPTTTIVIIAIVIMLIATALIFLALPYFEDEFGPPGPCDDTCYQYSPGQFHRLYRDCELSNRYIQHYHNSPYESGWKYHDGFEGYESKIFDSLLELRKKIQAEYEGENISESSWHWFMCTAEAID